MGDLVCLEEGYASGIWLRERPDVMKSGPSSRVPHGTVMVIIELSGDSVRVMCAEGRSGWTFVNRLVKLEAIKV